MKGHRQTETAAALEQMLPYVWSIGIYTGESPFNLAPASNTHNPVLSATDVTDLRAVFVADPFMIRANDNWYMFFEVFNAGTLKGEIGLATSDNGWTWKYQRIVLKEPYHLSYPYVFAWQGEHYMVPETLGAKSIQLYKAASFPHDWLLGGSLVAGELSDSTLFRFSERWWMFSCSTPH